MSLIERVPEKWAALAAVVLVAVTVVLAVLENAVPLVLLSIK